MNAIFDAKQRGGSGGETSQISSGSELADDGKRERHEVSEQRDRNDGQRSQFKEVIGGGFGGEAKILSWIRTWRILC